MLNTIFKNIFIFFIILGFFTIYFIQFNTALNKHYSLMTNTSRFNLFLVKLLTYGLVLTLIVSYFYIFALEPVYCAEAHNNIVEGAKQYC